MTYNVLDWACDQIMAYEMNHGEKPGCFLVTPMQAVGLMEVVSIQTRIPRSSEGFINSIRKGEAYLCGIQLKLFEVPHGQAQ